MAEIRSVTILTTKRLEIERAIDGYEQELIKLRASLSAVIAATALFEQGAVEGTPSFVDMRRLFRRGDMGKICLAALEAEGPLDTRELAVRLLKAKGFNADDAVLRKTVALRIVHAMRDQFKRGKVGDAGRRNGVRVWKPVARTPR